MTEIEAKALAIDQFLSHQIERDTLACDLTQTELTELATGLVAIASMPTVQAEPVAWMYEHPDDPTDYGTMRLTNADKAAGWTETPLYAHPPSPQWQGIESAPRDGMVIDVWRDGHRETVYWGLPPHTCGEMGECCDSDWHRIKGLGWVCSTFGEFLGGKHNPFTHWMPLPTPPAGGSDE